LTIFDRRAFRQEIRLYRDFDLAGNSAVHADDLPESLKSHHTEKFWRNQSPGRHGGIPIAKNFKTVVST
jgi:hypothetical protein